MATHEVTNQAPPLVLDRFSADPPLLDALDRHGRDRPTDRLAKLGRLAGSSEVAELARLANEAEPVLWTHDRYGHRIDRVEYHPAYHELMRTAVDHGLAGATWADDEPGAHVARAAGFYVWSQAEAGHGCPMSMTYSIVPALRAQPEISAEWEPRLTATTYDSADRPAADKAGALAGMAMTEKQGGSDVRANSTTAAPLNGGGPGGEYLLTGHKWFCSAPMGDLFLMLAHAPGGLSCFAVPRWRPDGSRNAIAIQRLKDKLGNRSNASSEIELEGTWGRLVGAEGRGVPTIITMVNHTRLDCVIGASAGMRAAVTQAIHHIRHRAAFGKRLADQPLMANVAADLALESEAATTTMTRLAAAYDAGDDPHEAGLRRIATAVSKYWICKRNPLVAVEAMECLGGNGYVEESGMPRLFRESPLNGIWEGSANVMCLDVLRAMLRAPEALEAFRAELELARGADGRMDAALDALDAELADLDDPEWRARRVVERMAVTLQASLLVRHAPGPVADAFCAGRLGGRPGDGGGRVLGTLPPGCDTDAIIERALPNTG